MLRYLLINTINRNSDNWSLIGTGNTYDLVSEDGGKYIKVIAEYNGQTFQDIVGTIGSRESSSGSSSSSSSSAQNNSNTNSNNNNANGNTQGNTIVSVPNGWQKQSDNTWKYGDGSLAVNTSIDGYAVDGNGAWSQ